MVTETIEITTSKEKFFLEYLTLKKPIIDALLTRINKKKTTLSDKPMRVLAELLYQNDKFKGNIPDDEVRFSTLFNKKMKDQMSEKLDMKEHHFNIYISQLRSIGIIDGKKIHKLFLISPTETHQLSFKFKLNGHS